jgi:1-acyl-sn-glycerol-3-phosphate acyltransferase
VHAVCPRARFVSKADVRHWPLLGWLIGAVGTLFIERERKRDALRVVHQVAASLKAGEVVAVFPEGTTGDGRALLPFHANLLQAAIAAEAPVQPVALRYTEPGLSWSPTVSWLGATTLVHSVWAIACARGVQVEVSALPARGSAHADRRALAQRLHDDIADALRLPNAATAQSEAAPAT